MTQSLETWLSIIAALAVGGTLIWSLTGLLSLLCRRGSAALRHRLWGLSCAAVLIAPLAALTVPLPRSLTWSVPLLKVAVTAPVVELSAVEMPEPHFTEMALDAGPEHGPPMFVDIGELSESAPQTDYVPIAFEFEDAISPASSAPPRDWGPSLFAVLIGLWCAGLLVALVHDVLARRRIAGLLRRSLAVTHEPVLQLARELTQRLGLRRPVRVLTSAETAVPFVTGVACPALVLPTGFGAWPAERLPVVLVHELMHVKRGDVAWQSLAQMCLAATWFHPLAWLALWRLRVEREHACDDAVLLAGYRPSDYASQLVEVASDLRRGTLRFAPAVAMASRSPIERRVRAILDATLQRGPAGRWRTAATLAGLSAMLLVVAAVTPGRSAAAVEESQAEVKQERAAADEKGNGEPPADAAVEEDEASRRVEQILNEKVDVKVDDMPLTDVLSDLARRHRIPIRLELLSFVQRGARLDKPISFNASGTTLRSALRLIVGTQHEPSIDPTIAVRHGVLVISLGEDVAAWVARAKSPEVLRPYQLRGTVRGADGNPVPDASIEVRSWCDVCFATADVRGEFEIPGQFAIQDITLIAKSTDGSLQAASPLIPAQYEFKPVDPEPMTLVLQPAKELTVQVTPQTAGAHVAFMAHPNLLAMRQTGLDGSVRFKMPEGLPVSLVAAYQPGEGLDYKSFPAPKQLGEIPSARQPANGETIPLKLEGARTARMRFVDENAQPVGELRVNPTQFRKPGEAEALSSTVLLPLGTRLTTAANGEVTFDWLPAWDDAPTTFEVSIPDRLRDRVVFDPQKVVDGVLTTVLRREVEVGGQVRDAAGMAAEEASRRVEQALDEHVDIGFVDARLSAVLAELARQCRTPIRLETVAFAKRGVSLHSPVTLQLTGVSLRSALKLLLQPLSDASDPNQPIFTGRSGLLVISLGPDAVERARSNPRSATPQPAMTISGIVRDAEGAPAPGIAVSIHEWQSTTLMTTDADGRFIVTVNGVPRSAVARNANGDLQAYWLPTYPLKDNAKELSAELKLEPARRLEIQVVSRGKPVQAANAAVVFRDGQTEVRRTDETGTARFSTPADETIEAICAWSSGLGLDYVNYSDPRSYNSPNRPLPPQPEGQILLQLNRAKTATIHLQDETGLPAAGVGVYPWTFQKAGQLDSLNLSFLADEVSQVADATGNATFDWLPDWQEGPITFWPRSTEFVHSRINFDPEKAVDRTVTHILRRYVEVSGAVLDSVERPVGHAQISAVGAGHSFDDGRGAATTDEQGRYTMRLAPDQIYLVTAASSDGKQKGTVSSFVLRSGEPAKPVGIRIQPVTRVFGRVTLGPNPTPQPNSQIQVYHYGTGLHELEGVTLSNPDNSNYAVQPINVYSTQTDAAGQFELLLGPGKYDIRGPAQVAIRKFTISTERELEFNFHSARPDRGLLKGRVVTGDPPVGVAHAKISGIARYQLSGLDLDATADADGNFQVDRERFATVLHARSPKGDPVLGGILEIGPDDETVTLSVSPVATCRLRVLDAKGNPLPEGREINYGVSVELGKQAGIYRTAFGGGVQVDPEGCVVLNSLVVGQKYEVRLVSEEGNSFALVTDLAPEQPGYTDLGDVTMPRERAPYKPPTLAERIKGAFESRQAPIERHANALRDAPLGTLRILTVFAAPEAPWVESLFEVHFDREKTGTLWDNYRTLAVSLSPEKRADAETLARKLGVTLPADRTPLLVVQDAAGKVLVSWTGEDVLTTDGKTVDRQKLLALLQMLIPEATNARTLLDDAIKQAKAENKRVFVQETATWCGPCWMLSRFLDRHRENWSQDYIWVKLDSRWEHAQEIAKELRQEAEGGIPWVAILDADGKTLATSNDSEGENIGFPSKSEPDGIRHFLKMLRSTSQRMTEDDFQTLQRALEGTE